MKNRKANRTLIGICVMLALLLPTACSEDEQPVEAPASEEAQQATPAEAPKQEAESAEAEPEPEAETPAEAETPEAVPTETEETFEAAPEEVEIDEAEPIETPTQTEEAPEAKAEEPEAEPEAEAGAEEPEAEEEGEITEAATLYEWREVPLSCKVTLTDGVVIDQNGHGELNITVADLPEGQYITVSITSENGCHLESEEGAIAYDLEAAQGIRISQNETRTISIDLHKDGNFIYAGVYNDTIYLNYRQFAYLPVEQAETTEVES